MVTEGLRPEWGQRRWAGRSAEGSSREEGALGQVRGEWNGNSGRACHGWQADMVGCAACWGSVPAQRNELVGTAAGGKHVLSGACGFQGPERQLRSWGLSTGTHCQVRGQKRQRLVGVKTAGGCEQGLESRSVVGACADEVGT